MSVLQPVVDDNGNLILHGRQGLDLILEFHDSTGALRNMTGVTTITFECGPTFNKSLTVNNGPLGQMKLTLTNADIKTIAAQTNREFVVIDGTQSQPAPVWAGTVFVTGWVE